MEHTTDAKPKRAIKDAIAADSNPQPMGIARTVMRENRELAAEWTTDKIHRIAEALLKAPNPYQMFLPGFNNFF